MSDTRDRLRAVQEQSNAADEEEKIRGAEPEKEAIKPKFMSSKSTKFTDFDPIEITPEQYAKALELESTMRNGVVMPEVEIRKLRSRWDRILTHVRQGKPVFFMSPEAGLPLAFFKKNQNATKSLVFRGMDDFTIDMLPRGQFHFGLMTGDRAIARLSDAGFHIVGCSGSANYYRNNVRGNRDALAASMKDQKRITELSNQGKIDGFIHKPSPALDLLVKAPLPKKDAVEGEPERLKY
jgi:hypothetical protein